MSVTIHNLKAVALAKGGILEGFTEPRWHPAGAQLKALVEALGGTYDPNDVFFGASLEDELLHNPSTGELALIGDWRIAIVGRVDEPLVKVPPGTRSRSQAWPSKVRRKISWDDL